MRLMTRIFLFSIFLIDYRSTGVIFHPDLGKDINNLHIHYHVVMKILTSEAFLEI